jgi:hypothetical protein
MDKRRSESTHHRVRTPSKIPVTADRKYAARYSIAVSDTILVQQERLLKNMQYFCHPDYESMIDIIETR